MLSIESVFKKSGYLKSFWFICMIILWERFSYYGLIVLLVLFFIVSVV